MLGKIIQGNNVDVLKTFPDNHFDSIVTDPPYGIDFLGKAWDANTGALETYQECLRVLKPGGHILAFSAARTYHHLAVTIEQAGFEIRDQIMWIYSSGFPKSQDIGKSIDRAIGKKDPNYGSYKCKKQEDGLVDNFGVGSRCKKCDRTFNTEIIQNCKEEPCGMRYNPQTEDGKAWSGWGTQLKPAHEPIVLARKPLGKNLSIARNAQKWGTGALNIDATRVPYESEYDAKHQEDIARGQENATNGTNFFGTGKSKSNKPSGGKGTAATHKNFSAENTDKEKTEFEPWEASQVGRFPSNVIGDIPDYQKYFYCPKVSRRERHIGHDNDSVLSHNEMAQAMGGSLVDHDGNPSVSGNKALIPGLGEIYTHGLSKAYDDWCKKNGHDFEKGNNHPTVKPIELMKYLIKLVTPAGGRILDPFNGSGSTGCAAVELDYDYTGIELDPAYVAIAERRIAAWYQHTHPNTFTKLFKTC